MQLPQKKFFFLHFLLFFFAFSKFRFNFEHFETKDDPDS